MLKATKAIKRNKSIDRKIFVSFIPDSLNNCYSELNEECPPVGRTLMKNDH
jgi:hypothetical protein